MNSAREELGKEMLINSGMLQKERTLAEVLGFGNKRKSGVD